MKMTQLSDAPVRFQSLLFRKETQIASLIGALLIIVPVWINYSQRAERIGRAILNGHDETAKKIITTYPKLLNGRDDGNGFTPLLWAVIAGRTNLVFWLIEKGADVNAADPFGMTPLHKTAVFNRKVRKFCSTASPATHIFRNPSLSKSMKQTS